MDLEFTSFSDRVTCYKCKQYFKRPRRLPCSCALCNDCVPQDPADNRFSCPSCISESNILQFGNFLIARPEYALATIHQYFCRSEILNCECCTNHDWCKAHVVAWCSFPECGFMCDQGLCAHESMRPLRCHTVFTESQLRDLFHNLNQPQVNLKTVPIQVTRETLCYSHSSEVLKYYCMNCSEILCTEGARLHPDGHEINGSLNNVYSQLGCKEKILTLIEQAKEKNRELLERQNTVASQREQNQGNKDLQAQLDSWTVQLNRTHLKLKAVIKSALNILDWIRAESAYLVLIEYKRIDNNLVACIREADELLNDVVVR